MPDLWYPGADRSQDRSQFSGVTMPRISKLLLHSTESSGWPAYPGFAPQATYDPWSHRWRQHMAINRSASTLSDPSSTAVRENRDDVVQVEIIGFCDPAASRKYGKSIQNMDDRAYEDLAAFAAWLNREWGLPLRSTVRWAPYPSSYGLHASQRLSGPEYDSYTGILGHQHASGGDHGDPGVIDAARIVRLAQNIVSGGTSTPLVVAPTQKGTHIMTEAKPLLRNRTEWQDVPAGDGTALLIDEPAKAGEDAPNSLVIGDTEGADLTCIVQVDGLQAGEVAEVYFARIYKGADGKNVIDGRYRNPGQVDIIGRADGRPASNSIRYAGSIGKHDPDFRLRVFIYTPRAVRARMNSRGWVIQ